MREKHLLGEMKIGNIYMEKTPSEKKLLGKKGHQEKR